MKINENGDLVSVVYEGITPVHSYPVATAAELKAAFAEKGKCVVPREPTPKMVFAGRDAIRANGGEGSEPTLMTDAIKAYRAMLQAAIKEAP